jgi:hypothetical protein
MLQGSLYDYKCLGTLRKIQAFWSSFPREVVSKFVHRNPFVAMFWGSKPCDHAIYLGGQSQWPGEACIYYLVLD